MSDPIENYTYDRLLEVVPAYVERNDAAFTEQVPGFITLAENRLATDLKLLGFQTVVEGQFVAGAVQPKPAFWRETISFSWLKGDVWQGQLNLRTLEYIKSFWPSQSMTGSPRFYADYDAEHFYVAPSPAANTPFELVFFARLDPLTEENQENWMTLNAPQALLAAVLHEAAKFVGNAQAEARWEKDYATALAGLAEENQNRLADRNTAVTK